jgi:hypothetical protein
MRNGIDSFVIYRIEIKAERMSCRPYGRDMETGLDRT